MHALFYGFRAAQVKTLEKVLDNKFEIPKCGTRKHLMPFNLLKSLHTYIHICIDNE